MRLESFQPFALATGLVSTGVAGFLAAGLAGCLLGTSTETVSTSIEKGKVALSDGKPAAGASIVLRSRKTVHSQPGAPAWQILAAATADGNGRFDFPAFPPGEVFLEIRQAADSGRPDTVAPFPEVYFARIDSADTRPVGSPGFRLAPAGALKGRISLGSGKPLDGFWIGVEGSSVLGKLGSREADGGYAFTLYGLYPGAHPLLLVPGSDVTIAMVHSASPPVATVKSDTVTDLGAIFYNDTSPVPAPR